MSTVINRLRREAGLTEQALADRAGVSKNYIQKLEHTTYEEASPEVISILSECTGLSVNAIAVEYFEEFMGKKVSWASIVSNAHHIDWNSFKKTMAIINWKVANVHPHVFLRQHICDQLVVPRSQIKWAQLHGIHPATLSKYELGKTPFMPPACREALVNSGVPIVLINDVILYSSEWASNVQR